MKKVISRMDNMDINKGFLWFFSGLGLTGLCFYLWFFTLHPLDFWLFIYALSTAALGGGIVWSVFYAISKNNPKGGFIGGIFSMISVIIIVISFLNEGVEGIHTIVTLFLSMCCFLLLFFSSTKI